MQSSSNSSPVAPTPDGTRFVLAAPEAIRLPTDGIHSFVFVTNGNPSPLPDGWISNQEWEGIEVIGAVTSLIGPGSALAQCGWITRLTWRWIRITNILRVEIRQDSRFRKGERCFWLITPLGEYVMLASHRGYHNSWVQSISQPDSLGPPALFRRTADSDPRPSWWDSAWEETWPPSVPEPPAGVKRTASSTPRPDHRSSSPEASAMVPERERRVRRREGSKQSGQESATMSSMEGDPVTLRQPATAEAQHLQQAIPVQVKPELGTKMSRCWDISRDKVAGPLVRDAAKANSRHSARK
ncbi:hypothetical protein RhiTH_009923 [Rhizoctonia solani]